MIDRRIKFRHLEVFATIARLGSLKAASEALHLTQPALSKTLKELEELLGARLMARSRAGVRLTPEGEVLEVFAGQSLAALRRGVEGVRAQSARRGEVLRVGVLPSVAARLVPRAVRLFLDWSPDAQLVLRDGVHQGLLAELRAGALDLVVGRAGAPQVMTGLSFTQLYMEQVVCVARPGHPLLQGGAVRPENWPENWPVIYPPARAAIRPLVDGWCLSRGLDLRHRIEAVSGAFGRNYVIESDALWFISQGVVAPDLEAGRLVALPLDLRLATGPVGLMTRPDDMPSAPQALFTRALRQIADDPPYPEQLEL